MKTAKDLNIPFTWAERRPILLDRFLYIPSRYDYTKKEFLLFEDRRPIMIEYCSGNGQWIGERAKQNPQYHWIAVEKDFERARKIWLKLHREEIVNLQVVCGEGLVFTQYYAPKAFEIYVNFPDPWPKLRHAKHRLIRAPFLQALSEILSPGGRVVCVTDDGPYAQQIAQEFAASPEWRLLFNVNEWPDYGSSFFNDLWTCKGKTIHYLAHERR